MSLQTYIELCLVAAPIFHVGFYNAIMCAVRKVGGIWFMRWGALRLSFCIAKGN